MERKTISAEEFDRIFDSGSDEIDQYLDWPSARRPQSGASRIVLDLPSSIIARVDQEAERHGLTRQALIEKWLADRLDAAA